MIGDLARRGTEEEIPVHTRRHRARIGGHRAQHGVVDRAHAPPWRHARIGRRGGRGDRRVGAGDSLRPEALRPVGPHVHFADGPEHAGGDQLVDAPRPFHGMPLIAHLVDDLRLARRPREESRLLHGVRERLLHVHVLPRLHRDVRGDGVRMIGRGDDDRVDVPLLVEHRAEVVVLLGLGVGFLQLHRLRPRRRLPLRRPEPAGELALDERVVDVADGDDVLASLEEGGRVRQPHPAEADHGDVERCAGSAIAGTAEHVARDDHRGHGEGGGSGGAVAHERATGDRIWTRRSSLGDPVDAEDSKLEGGARRPQWSSASGQMSRLST